MVGGAAVKYPGATYKRIYGYPLRWAVLSEIAWRIEHIGPFWLRYEGRPLAPIARWGYRQRRACERRGYAAGHGIAP